MGKTIEQMLADGVSPAEIHKMVDTELQKKREKDAAARKKELEARAAKEKAERKAKNIEVAKEIAAETLVAYLIEADAITKEDAADMRAIIKQSLVELADDLKRDQAMIKFLKKMGLLEQ